MQRSAVTTPDNPDRSETMAKSDDDNAAVLEGMGAFAMGMFSELAARAEPILQAKVAASSVSDFKDLGRDIAGAMLKDSLIEAATGHFIGLDLDGFRRGVDAFFDAGWLAAWGRVMSRLDEPRSAFDLATGPDIAMVLAGVGLAVVPLDKKTMRPIGVPTRDWREAAKTFGRVKTAYVGYNTAKAPFYALLTDCMNTMNYAVQNDARLAHARNAVARTGYGFQGVPSPFQHSTLLVPRDEGDQFETLVIEDPRLDRGSVMFLAGWQEDGETHGTTNDGFFAVPLQVVHAILNNPAFFAWVNPGSGKPSSVH